MGDFFDELGLTEEAHASEVVPSAPVAHYSPREMAQKRKEQALERIKGMEDNILQRSMGIIDAALNAPDIDIARHDPNDPNYLPEGWLERYNGDVEAAVRDYRIAVAAWSSKPPAFLKLASEQAAGIIKARSAQRGGDTNLNVVILTQNNNFSYPTKELADDDEA